MDSDSSDDSDEDEDEDEENGGSGTPVLQVLWFLKSRNWIWFSMKWSFKLAFIFFCLIFLSTYLTAT